jgi:hypothetical protein
MISSDVTEVIMASLRIRLNSDPVKSKEHHICTSLFYTLFDDRRNLRKQYSDECLPRSLEDIEEKVKQQPKLKVWIGYYANKHQIAICIDFGHNTIAYGKLFRSLWYCSQVAILMIHMQEIPFEGFYRQRSLCVTYMNG